MVGFQMLLFLTIELKIDKGDEMKQIFKENKVPIMSWATELEEKTLEQAINLTNLPFIHNHISLMPDAHLGYGMPIGGVITCKDVIIPHAVGSDIGCGVCFINTKLNINIIPLKEVLSEIRKLVPVGVKKHNKETNFLLDNMPCPDVRLNSIIHKLFTNAILQLGTLGSGNHFIELQKNSKDELCIMIHSGSRYMGYKICDYHNKIAINLNEKYYSSVLTKYELAFLPTNSKEGNDYIEDMNYCIEYAKANRKIMLSNCLEALNKVTLEEISMHNYIDVAHNYARLEHHFNKDVWVHRKGATSAKKDEIGLIPGSQGTSSFIVRGKGEKLSFNSCSHGAGRLMSRKRAKKELNFDEEVKRLNNKRIIHTIRTKDDLDESDGSYKNIYEVMDNQSDLVDIVEELKPLACIKGKIKRKY